MDHLFLVVRIAGHTVAVAAADVSSVVEVDRVAPVPRVPPHVAGLFALRSRVLTVIDAQAALGHPPMALDESLTAVIVTVDGHGYALLVDDVADVVTTAAPAPCAALLGSAWTHVGAGQIETPAGPMLVVDPARLIDGPSTAIAA